jgi:hypothetical protein
LAAAPLCPAELVGVTATLDLITPTVNTFSIFCDLNISGFAAQATTSSTASGTSRFQLNCTFDGSTHAVTKIEDIKFLFADSDGDPAPLTFQDISLFFDFGIGTLDIHSEGFSGSTSTGLQHEFYEVPQNPEENPALIPFVPVNGSGEFLLNIDPDTTPKMSDFLLYISGGAFTIKGADPIVWPYPPGLSLIDITWSQWPDVSVTVDTPMPGSGTVSVGLPSIDAGVATYGVDVSIPISATFPVPNPAGPGRVGFMTATGTMEMSGEFTRVVSTPVVGDANGDGDVDDEDASILGAHWLQSVSGGWDDGDFNIDGVVNDKDAAIMAANWSSPAGGNAVPEPSTAALLLGLALAGLAAWRRR